MGLKLCHCAFLIVSDFLFKSIPLSLGKLSLLCFIAGIFFTVRGSSFFVEWVLRGASISFSVTILLDFIACFFLSVVFLISSCVVWYRRAYISRDINADRFILIVLGFVVSMALLITSPNIFSVLLGWDGLGLISYCLVVYYPTPKSSRAGMLTVISNRIGDVCILVTIGLFVSIGDFVFPLWVICSLQENQSSVLGPLIIVAAITKRAQVPFSAWLPAAMAAPTPVSALVHSSTLVTAGVYLLIRFSIGSDYQCFPLLVRISTLTIFFSGLVALFEYDLKKIIALSTLSQLGVMIFSISLGLPYIAFFHLLTHALFKALLFLCAGACIHQVGGPQDLRFFGILVKNSPLIISSINLANLSLCGIPFLSGFYSKDLIVEYAAQGSWNLFIVFIIFISLGITVAYSTRLSYITFVQFPRSSSYSLLSDVDTVLVVPIIVLIAAALLSGPSLIWLLVEFPDLVFLPASVKTLTLFIITSSLILSWRSRFERLFLSPSQTSRYFFWGSMIFLPFLSGQKIRSAILEVGDKTVKSLDAGWLEFSLEDLLRIFFVTLGNLVSLWQTNQLKSHILSFCVWLFVIIFYVVYLSSLKH